MTTSSSSANAQALPYAHPPRRGFLAGLAALPLIGGSAALVGRLDIGTEPTGLSGDDQLATLDDYAAATFDSLDVDLKKVREAYDDMWTSLAVGMTMMTKSPAQCRDLAASMSDDLDCATAMLSSLRDGAAWYRQAAEIIESAEARFLGGAARLVKEGGADA